MAKAKTKVDDRETLTRVLIPRTLRFMWEHHLVNGPMLAVGDEIEDADGYLATVEKVMVGTTIASEKIHFDPSAWMWGRSSQAVREIDGEKYPQWIISYGYIVNYGNSRRRMAEQAIPAFKGIHHVPAYGQRPDDALMETVIDVGLYVPATMADDPEAMAQLEQQWPQSKRFGISPNYVTYLAKGNGW